MTWDLLQGSKLNCQKEAHSRLITSVKIYEDQIFSSSRDRSIKVWDLLSLSPIQTLTGPHTIFYHNHSVWSIDICENYLISASADQTLGVWKKEANDWHFQHKLNNEEAVRNVIILKKSPNLALSGDLIGDLKVNTKKITYISINFTEFCISSIYRFGICAVIHFCTKYLIQRILDYSEKEE